VLTTGGCTCSVRDVDAQLDDLEFERGKRQEDKERIAHKIARAR